MKFVSLRRFVNFEWKNGGINNTERSVKNKSSNQQKVFQKVVKFEDCEKVNRLFVLENMETTSNRNQYLAAVTGYCS
jgi:hypothetical protein